MSTKCIHITNTNTQQSATFSTEEMGVRKLKKKYTLRNIQF